MSRHPGAIILLALVATISAGWFAARHLRLNTDTAALLSPTLPFRQSQSEFQREFPAQVDVFVAVVDAATAEQAENAANALAARLNDRPEAFFAARVEGAEAYYQRNALLYLDPDELRETAERLIAGQAMIGIVAREPSLSNLAAGLATILRQARVDDTAAIERLLSGLRPGLAEPPATVSWQKLLAPDSPAVSPTRRLVLISPRLDFQELLPADRPMRVLRTAIAAVTAEQDRAVTIRVTGDAALSHEEMTAAASGAMLTGALALVVVGALLRVGLGSAWLAAASLTSLLTGLILTAGFAALAVGELNLISTAFALLYIGLAADYSIHFCLGYRERLRGHGSPAAALEAAARDLARPLALCTVTTAIGFFAFLPTSFRGVAELGLIAGIGMFINLALTFVLLPALLRCGPVPAAWTPAGSSSPGHTLPVRYPGALLAVSAALTISATGFLASLHFERDPLKLRDPQAESVRTWRDLLAADSPRLLEAVVLAPGEAAARALASKLRALPEVREVLTVENVIPAASDEKLAIIDELAILLDLPDAEPVPGAVESPADLAALERLQRAARDYADSIGGNDARAFAADLGAALDRIRRTGADVVAVRALEQSLTGTLPQAVARLRSMLSPDRTPAAALPVTIRNQWIGASGKWRLSVVPRAALADNAELRAFVEAVQRVAPGATGEPVLSLRAGDEIVLAFASAFALAAAAIAILLAALLRKLAQVLAVLLPVGCAGALTGASLVMLDVPLNFANVIALPLLFGMGVDNGVHMLQRALSDSAFGAAPLGSATARAILFSGATTLAGFGTLMLSPHPGLASMGTVLSLGIGWILLVTLLGLPAALVLHVRGRR